MRGRAAQDLSRRKLWGRALVLAALPFLAGAARADLLAWYDFPQEGTLDGLEGGEGWVGPWTANAVPVELVPAPAHFDYDVPGGGTVAATGAARLLADADMVLTRPLETIDAEEVYISFLLEWTGGPLGENDFAVWWFETSHDTPNIGLKSNLGPDARQDFMCRFLLSSEAWAPDQIQPGETYFIVGRLAKSDGWFYDTYDIWVNPSFGEAAAPEATAEGAGTIETLTVIGVRTANLEPGDELILGTLRIGTGWEDVVPPEGGGGTEFVRGDINVDGTVNIADAIALLGTLFSGIPDPSCRAAADANDDGIMNIADAIAVLAHLFGGGGGDLPPPAGSCGTDPTEDPLGCSSFELCN